MEGRPISDLKVAELRKELEKRNKDKTGVKQVLLDRLKETLEKDGHDPQTYRFRDDDSVKTDLEISDHSPVNGDGLGSEKVGPITKRRSPSDDVLSDEYIISEHPLQKKITEETVPYVVQVGEQEEDLDYDLKYGNNDVSEVAGDSKDTQVKDEELDKHENKPERFVVSATVVMSTRTPGGCFGFIQMASAEEAASAARAYDLTEFGGCILRVEATERKAPIQSNKANDRVAGLNKLKTSMPDSRRTVSRPLVSRRRYIANRQRLLRRAAIRTAILREQRKRSEYLSANNRPHSIKKTPIRRPLYQFTRPNYRMSKDSLRSRGGLALASKHKSISQRQSSSRIKVHRSSNICPENHRSCLSPPSRLIPLNTLTSKRNPIFRTNRPVERDIREPYRPVLPERKYHPQSPGRSHESSRYARNTQSSVYTGRNTAKSVYDSRSRQSHLMTRSEPR
uniref:SAFB-like transcription modulator n=1 Tax=Schistosoma haematobium TaxID=6185 RepID=A0A095A2S7_SCHHA